MRRGQTEAVRMAEQHAAADARAAAAGEDLVRAQAAADGDLAGVRAEAAAARADARAAQDALAAATAGFEASKAGFEARGARLAAEAAAAQGEATAAAERAEQVRPAPAPDSACLRRGPSSTVSNKLH